MTCARTGVADAVRLLAERGADLNARETHRGQTALMWAVGGKHPEAVEVLIERGADVNAVSSGGFTPLMFAAREGDVESARLLLAAGARLDDTTPAGESALLLAAASVSGLTARDYRLVPEPSGHEAVAMLLVERGANVDQADTFGLTALHHAVETGKRDLLKALIARGAELERAPGAAGAAVPARRLRLARRFWRRHARSGWPRCTARSRRCGALEAAGADWRLPSRNGTTPLMVAAGLGQTDSRIVPESRLLEAVKYLGVARRRRQRSEHRRSDRGARRRRRLRPRHHRLPGLAEREPRGEGQGRPHANRRHAHHPASSARDRGGNPQAAPAVGPLNKQLATKARKAGEPRKHEDTKRHWCQFRAFAFSWPVFSVFVACCLSGPDPDVPPQLLGRRLAAIDIPVAIDGHEFRAVAGG